MSDSEGSEMDLQYGQWYNMMKLNVWFLIAATSLG